jgi:hypothetical protein
MKSWIAVMASLGLLSAGCSRSEDANSTSSEQAAPPAPLPAPTGEAPTVPASAIQPSSDAPTYPKKVTPVITDAGAPPPADGGTFPPDAGPMTDAGRSSIIPRPTRSDTPTTPTTPTAPAKPAATPPATPTPPRPSFKVAPK